MQARMVYGALPCIEARVGCAAGFWAWSGRCVQVQGVRERTGRRGSRGAVHSALRRESLKCMEGWGWDWCLGSGRALGVECAGASDEEKGWGRGFRRLLRSCCLLSSPVVASFCGSIIYFHLASFTGLTARGAPWSRKQVAASLQRYLESLTSALCLLPSQV